MKTETQYDLLNTAVEVVARQFKAIKKDEVQINRDFDLVNVKEAVTKYIDETTSAVQRPELQLGMDAVFNAAPIVAQAIEIATAIRNGQVKEALRENNATIPEDKGEMDYHPFGATHVQTLENDSADYFATPIYEDGKYSPDYRSCETRLNVDTNYRFSDGHIETAERVCEYQLQQKGIAALS